MHRRVAAGVARFAVCVSSDHLRCDAATPRRAKGASVHGRVCGQCVAKRSEQNPAGPTTHAGSQTSAPGVGSPTGRASKQRVAQMGATSARRRTPPGSKGPAGTTSLSAALTGDKGGGKPVPEKCGTSARRGFCRLSSVKVWSVFGQKVEGGFACLGKCVPTWVNVLDLCPRLWSVGLSQRTVTFA